MKEACQPSAPVIKAKGVSFRIKQDDGCQLSYRQNRQHTPDTAFESKKVPTTLAPISQTKLQDLKATATSIIEQETIDDVIPLTN